MTTPTKTYERPSSNLVRDIDRRLDRLVEQKDVWPHLPPAEKAALLTQCRQRLRPIAARWVETANRAKAIPRGSPWAAEEWYEIYAVSRALRAYAEALVALDQGHLPVPSRWWMRPNGQAITRVFPHDLYDALLFNGLTVETWLQPGATAANLSEHIAAAYREPLPVGGVALVLGAGNVNSIPPLDVLSKLVVEAQVVLLKLSPINAYLQSLLEELFAPLIEPGFVVITSGDDAFGRYLTTHSAVDTIHLTGSAATADAIREAVDKPLTTELGGVSPVIVVPGDWRASDIRFQAENIVTMKLYNGGFNCSAAQLLILPNQWSQRQALQDAIRQTMRDLPPQPAHYPGVEDRIAAACAHYPSAEAVSDVSATKAPPVMIPSLAPARGPALEDEFFGPILAVVSLAGATPEAFLQQAVAFCNERLTGTLAADLIVHPRTLSQHQPAVDQAVADLRYGAIGVNGWASITYRIIHAPWGAFQTGDGGTESGNGTVHNAALFERPQKSVVRGAFHPFPRTWLNGQAAILPRPPWFVTSKQRNTTARRVAQFELDRNPLRLPGIFAAALRG